MFFWKKAKEQLCGCGDKAIGGYSPRSESLPEEIEPICDTCARSRLSEQIQKFDFRAIVFQPSAEEPCYVFRPLSFLDKSLLETVDKLLSQIGPNCEDCNLQARFLWVPKPMEQEAFFRGLDVVTLPRQSLCARCCASKVRGYCGQFAFLEICGPASEPGIQVAMGY